MSRGRLIATIAQAGLVAAMLAAAPAQAADVSSTFDTDLDGWTITGDPQAGSPVWVSSGGNPGGFARTIDRGGGSYMFWQAPAKFEGDQSGKLGGALSFDVRVNPGGTNAWPDAYLEGAGVILAANTRDFHSGGWDANSVPLEGAAWRVAPSYDAQNASLGAPVDDATLASVLGSLEKLVVRAEQSTFLDTDDLDNVVLAGPAGPASLELTPAVAEQEAGATHCVTATVADADGDPVEGAAVRFSTSGATSTTGTRTSGSDGTATYCFDGPALPGSSDIDAYADSDGDGIRDPDEPADTATVTWTRPATGTDCKVTGGGRIATADGEKATFGGNAKSKDGTASGHHTYHDHGEPGRTIKTASIDAVVCSSDGTAVTVFATATDGATLRLDLRDGGEPGVDDGYRLRSSDGYDTGEQPLEAGNIQIHGGKR